MEGLQGRLVPSCNRNRVALDVEDTPHLIAHRAEAAHLFILHAQVCHPLIGGMLVFVQSLLQDMNGVVFLRQLSLNLS